MGVSCDYIIEAYRGMGVTAYLRASTSADEPSSRAPRIIHHALGRLPGTSTVILFDNDSLLTRLNFSKCDERNLFTNAPILLCSNKLDIYETKWHSLLYLGFPFIEVGVITFRSTHNAFIFCLQH
jgi:hypothetical protein